MLDRIYNLEEKRRLVEEMMARANAFLAGQVGPIEAARSLASFQGLDKHLDDMLTTFAGVDSETDALPLGEVRRLWNAEALKRQDFEIAKADARHRDKVAVACRALVERLAPVLAELRDQHRPRPS